MSDPSISIPDVAKLAVTDLEDGLERCGSYTFLLEMTEEMQTELTTQETTMAKAAKDGDYKSYYEAAHSVKGASLMLGLVALSEICKYMESIGKAIANDESKHSTDEINAYKKNMTDALVVYRNEISRMEGMIPEIKALADAESSEEESDDYE